MLLAWLYQDTNFAKKCHFLLSCNMSCVAIAVCLSAGGQTLKANLTQSQYSWQMCHGRQPAMVREENRLPILKFRSSTQSFTLFMLTKLFAGILEAYCCARKIIDNSVKKQHEPVTFREAFKRASLRWHPDRFCQRFNIRHLEEVQQKEILQRVKAISQEINIEWDIYRDA